MSKEIVSLCNSHAAEKKQNAAAAPDAIKVNALAWPVPAAPAEAEEKVNGDFVLRPKLMNSPESIC